MQNGQRVEIIDGVLRGERATIQPHPISEQYEDGEGMVWLHFDNHEKVYGPEKGYAILSEQWFEIERLKLLL